MPDRSFRLLPLAAVLTLAACGSGIADPDNAVDDRSRDNIATDYDLTGADAAPNTADVPVAGNLQMGVTDEAAGDGTAGAGAGASAGTGTPASAGSYSGGPTGTGTTGATAGSGGRSGSGDLVNPRAAPGGAPTGASPGGGGTTTAP
jgi:hypothetical protein